ncbi:hypothetical protein BDF20DRAFT_832636 [Mycotypha africana]|uniref:uncharacterized protein n=1 Tax=Mycotypha africana TaxID=64632 RepID=UPI002300FBE2|nr:uncharacterized protein BDF20DRAFT_832636 [Mycotypha africana]KAI8987730.1 hypothetical protein BDF20DRAFT_832636 [Mycotypha africana]
MTFPLPPAQLVSLRNSCFICPEIDCNTRAKLEEASSQIPQPIMPSRNIRLKHKDINEIIPHCTNIIVFTVADNLHASHQPKLAAETIKILQPLVTISAGYNRNISSNLRLKSEENLTEQASLASLKFLKNAFDLLKSALEKSRDSLPKYL